MFRRMCTGLLLAGATSLAAWAQPVISLQSNSPQCAEPGDAFQVLVILNSAPEPISGASLEIIYDDSRLDFVSIVAGDDFQFLGPPGTHTPGVLSRYTYGVCPSPPCGSGVTSGEIAVINFTIADDADDFCGELAGEGGNPASLVQFNPGPTPSGDLTELGASDGTVYADGTNLTANDLGPDDVRIDTTAPVFASQGTNVNVNITSGATCAASATIPARVVTDNCDTALTLTAVRGDGGIITQNVNGSWQGTFPVGTTTVTFTATDDCGNFATHVVTVNVTDGRLPTLTCPPNFTGVTDPGQCTHDYNGPAPTASDNCPPPPTITIDRSDVPGASNNLYDPPYPVGVTTVTATATDAHNNVSTCSFTITITDEQDPDITCPVPQNPYSAGANCCAQVALVASAGDNCPGVTVENDFNDGGADASDCYPVGTTTVCFTATDEAGNTDVCCVDVIVVDDTAPTITCPEEPQKYAATDGCTRTVDLTSLVSASDNCEDGKCGVNITFAEGNAEAGPFTPVPTPPGPAGYVASGVTWIQATATDCHGNSVSCVFQLQINDTIAPVITCPPAPSPFLCSDDAVAYIDNLVATANSGGPGTISYSDNCVPTASLKFQNDAPLHFPNGCTDVTFMVIEPGDDGLSDSCTVTICVEDAPPTIECPDDVSATTDPGTCSYDAPNNSLPYSADDFCDGDLTAQVHIDRSDIPGPGPDNLYDPAYPIGTTTVTLSVTDSADPGNTVTCSFTVTVADDEGPTITSCPANITTDVQISGAGIPEACGYAIVDLPEPATASDNCDSDVVIKYWLHYGTPDEEELTFPHLFSSGTHTITVEACDDATPANCSTCTFTVTVQNQVRVKLRVQLLGVTNTVTRCLDISLERADATCDLYASQSVTFSDSSDSLGRIGEIELTVPCDDYSTLQCSVEDPVHTLRRLGNISVSGDNTHYVADFIGAAPISGSDPRPDPAILNHGLITGDVANNDGDVNIGDFSVLVNQYGAPRAANTCNWATESDNNADLDGDGQVGNNDYQLLAGSYQLEGTADPCGVGQRTSDAPQSYTIDELIAAGHGDWALADINQDGVLNDADMAAFAANPRPYFRGDVNNNGVVNVNDIAAFVLTLTEGQQAYLRQYPDSNFYMADVNADGRVTVGDISAFVELLTQGAN